MKTHIWLFAAVSALIMSSCAKDFTCECTCTNQEDFTDTYTSESDLRNTKKESEENCEYLEGTSYNGDRVYDVTCELFKG